MAEPEYEYDDRDEGVICPRCMGDGSVSCHCGGDLCVCDNYGERDCPVCFGEGDVSREREGQYLKAEGEAMAAMRAAWPTPSDKEGGE